MEKTEETGIWVDRTVETTMAEIKANYISCFVVTLKHLSMSSNQLFPLLEASMNEVGLGNQKLDFQNNQSWHTYLQSGFASSPVKQSGLHHGRVGGLKRRNER